jgi:hypothetical protein
VGQSHQSNSHPPIKKSKPISLQGPTQIHKANEIHDRHIIQEAHNASLGLLSHNLLDSTQDKTQENLGSQGMLEDMVPFMVRNPTNNVDSD